MFKFLAPLVVLLALAQLADAGLFGRRGGRGSCGSAGCGLAVEVVVGQPAPQAQRSVQAAPTVGSEGEGRERRHLVKNLIGRFHRGGRGCR